MKGLLLKDWYLTKKYCRTYLITAVMFLVIFFGYSKNLFCVFYPCMLAGSIPVTLLGYDERSKWNTYSGTLPYTKSQIVSGKYLIGLFAQIAALGLSGAAHALKMLVSDSFQAHDFLVLMLMLFVMSCVSPSITLPFMFKFGVEKGRIAYYAMFGVASAGSFAFSDLFRADLSGEISAGGILMVFSIAGAAIYALSWYLSTVFYKKRENY